MMTGKHLITMNHLHLVMERFGALEHHLRLEDVNRTDRQNWGSAQRIMFPSVRRCLTKIEEGHDGKYTLPFRTVLK